MTARSGHVAQLKESGSFFAGGQKVTLTGQPSQQVQVARNAPPREVDLNGDYITAQCYVQYITQQMPLFDHPVMFWHGGAMTGATWENRPGGEPGWQNHFLQRGFDTFVCDAVERGRAGWSPYPQIYESSPIHRTLNDAWSLFRFGDPTGYATDPAAREPFEGLRFPVEHFDVMAAQFVPRWTDHAAITMDAYEAALDKTGPVWLVAHSQGGNLALEAAARFPEYILGLVVIEPASAPAGLAAVPKVPHLFVWGDNIDQVPIWQNYRAGADAYMDQLRAAGASVSLLDLPAEGIHGNSHVPMMDSNAGEIADRVIDWIAALV